MASEKHIANNAVNELEWVSFASATESPSFLSKLKSKGIFGILIPLGCISTAGVLGVGILQLIKKNKQKQQYYMRLRVASQGVTLAVAVVGMLYIGKFN